MAAVFPRLGGRAEALKRDKPDHFFRLWQPRGIGLAIAVLVVLAYIALNVAILVVVPLPQVSLTSDGKGQGLAGKYYAAVIYSLIALAIAYYTFVISDSSQYKSSLATVAYPDFFRIFQNASLRVPQQMTNAYKGSSTSSGSPAAPASPRL